MNRSKTSDALNAVQSDLIRMETKHGCSYRDELIAMEGVRVALENLGLTDDEKKAGAVLDSIIARGKCAVSDITACVKALCHILDKQEVRGDRALMRKQLRERLFALETYQMCSESDILVSLRALNAVLESQIRAEDKRIAARL